MNRLPSEEIMKRIRGLYGISRLEWNKIRLVMDRSFEVKEREAEKTICLSSDEDIVDPF